MFKSYEVRRDGVEISAGHRLGNLVDLVDSKTKNRKKDKIPSIRKVYKRHIRASPPNKKQVNLVSNCC